MHNYIRCLFIGIGISISCTSAGPDEVLVRSVVTGIIEADNRSDIDKVLSYYHSDAVLYPPGRPEIRGEDAIRVNYESLFASSTLQIDIEVHDVTIDRDSAVVTGVNTGRRISREDQHATDIHDPFVMTLEKVNGEWKISELRWN